MTRRYAAWGTLVPVVVLTLILGLALRPRSPAANAPGDMGIVVTDLTPAACREAGIESGVLVVSVLPGGPADKKGIEEGDIITKYESRPVRSAVTFLGRIRRDGEGYLASVHILRDGSEKWLGFVTLAAQPAPPPTGDEIEARFARLEDEVDALRARVDALEKARAIPRRPAVTR